jgi:hypothetical protein
MNNRMIESHFIANDIEIIEEGIDINLEESWINNLSQDKRIALRNIKFNIDTNAGFPVKLFIMYYHYINSNYMIYYTTLEFNLNNQSTEEIRDIFEYQINDWLRNNIPGNLGNSFTVSIQDEIYWQFHWDNYLGIDYFRFYLDGDYTKTHFTIINDNESNTADYVVIDSGHIKCLLAPFIYNTGTGDYDLVEFLPTYDFANIYFHWDISRDVNNYVCEVDRIKEAEYSKEYEMDNVKSYRIDSIKYGNDTRVIFKFGVGNNGINNTITVEEDVDENINLGTAKINFWFTNDGTTKIHVY